MQLDNLLQQSWKNHPSACEPALAVMRRVWLCEMRGVSTGWRNAGEYLGRLRLRFSRLAFLLAGIHLAARSDGPGRYSAYCSSRVSRMRVSVHYSLIFMKSIREAKDS